MSNSFICISKEIILTQSFLCHTVHRHFLYNKAAEIDWTIRLQQFFDYYLKDAPMPRWMKEGINANERGVDQKYDFVE